MADKTGYFLVIEIFAVNFGYSLARCPLTFRNLLHFFKLKIYHYPGFNNILFTSRTYMDILWPKKLYTFCKKKSINYCRIVSTLRGANVCSGFF